MTPKAGNKTIGNKAVAAIGMASLIQNVAINAAMAATCMLFSGIPGESGINNNAINNTGPEMRPVSFLWLMLLSNSGKLYNRFIVKVKCVGNFSIIMLYTSRRSYCYVNHALIQEVVPHINLNYDKQNLI